MAEEHLMSQSRLSLAIAGAIGAVAPDIVILYSKRWSAPDLSFDTVQYAVATAIYVALAAFVAAIFPYGDKRSSWKAFAIGVGLPVVLSALATLGTGARISPRGFGALPGTLLDLMAMR
jgi:hypothetical protein